MFILQIEAFGDFDVYYYLNVCAFSNRKTANSLQKALNDYLEGKPELDKDILLSEYFKDEANKKELKDVVCSVLTNNEQVHFVTNRILELCKKHCIYINTNTFYIEEVKTF